MARIPAFAAFAFMALVATAAPARGFSPFAESSGTVDGLQYEYRIDNGAVVNGSIDGPATAPGLAMDDPDRWVVYVDRDKMTDRARWYIAHYQTGLTLAVTPSSSISMLCVIGADFPGRPIAVRIGTAPPHSFGDECAAPPARLKAELLRGGTLRTRGYKWPYDYPRDREGRADGFAQAIQLYRYLRSIDAGS